MSEADRIRDYFGSATWRASPGRRYLVRERVALLQSIASGLARPFDELSVCDVGCGAGTDLADWRGAGVPEANLAGTELVAERAAIAGEALPAADIRVVDGFDLPFPSDSFDICSASLVLSTVRSTAQRDQLLAEMARVTAPAGMVIVYDFAIRKPWNRNVASVTTAGLASMWRTPDRVILAAPFLPALDVALRLPRPLGLRMIRVLPRTHRVWVWRVPPAAGDR